MKQTTFIKVLKAQLETCNVEDIQEIIEEYNEHFLYKIEEGYSEEEVCKRLGDPIEIASQYNEEKPTIRKTKSKTIPAVIGLGLIDLVAVQFYVLLVAFVLVFFVVALAAFGIGGSLFLDISPYGWIPVMPYWCGAILGISFMSLGVLSLIGMYYNYLYIKQVAKSYFRFHSNFIKNLKGEPMLPSLRMTPKLSGKQGRIIRKITLFAFNTFAVSFVLGYIVCTITAGVLGFWHEWGWFV